MRSRLFVLLAPIFLSGWAAVPVLAGEPLVELPVGKLRGAAVGDLHVFKGIPYASPPVGPRRWKPPVSLPAWSGVRDATQFGAACVQPQPRAGGLPHLPEVFAEGLTCRWR